MEDNLSVIQPQVSSSQFAILSLSQIEPNEGQLEGLPANPRFIHEAKFKTLKKNIMEHPEFLKYNMLKVFGLDNGNYIVIGGNMRYHALKDLGFTQCPVAIIDPSTSIEDLKAFAILDNVSAGKWEWSMIANEWDAAQLTDWGVDLPIMETDINVDDFFDALDDAESKAKDDKITITIPTEYAEAKADIKSLIEDALSGEYSECKVK